MGHRIITKGYGPSLGVTQRAGIITQGYGGIPLFIPAVIDNAIKQVHGRSSIRSEKRIARDLDSIIVWAKLQSVNDKPIAGVSGKVTITKRQRQNRVLAEYIKRQLSKIKINVKRLK